MRLLLVSLAIAGCASAGPANSIVGGIDDAGVRSTDGRVAPGIDASERVDASERPDADPAIDASLIDAPPARITLNQTTIPDIVDNNSLACPPPTSTPNANPANSYYRVFAPADARGGGTLHVTDVSFAIEDAVSATANKLQPATIRLGTYDGAFGAVTLDLAKIHPLTTMDIQIADASLDRLTVPITADVPGTASLIVELALPANTTLNRQFFIGSNAGGEISPGYLRASTCGYTAPTSLTKVASDAASGPMDVLISVSGTL
ncbi:MAG: hypothetical protein ABIY55_09985 [Kofleriaceae bacterium]